MPVRWNTCSGVTYMSAGTLGARLYFMAVCWNTCSGATYMLTGTLRVQLYFMPVCWNACSGVTYMPAGMLGALHIYLGQYAICTAKILYQPRLAGTLYAPFWQILYYAYSNKY